MSGATLGPGAAAVAWRWSVGAAIGDKRLVVFRGASAEQRRRTRRDATRRGDGNKCRVIQSLAARRASRHRALAFVPLLNSTFGRPENTENTARSHHFLSRICHANTTIALTCVRLPTTCDSLIVSHDSGRVACDKGIHGRPTRLAKLKPYVYDDDDDDDERTTRVKLGNDHPGEKKANAYGATNIYVYDIGTYV